MLYRVLHNLWVGKSILPAGTMSRLASVPPKAMEVLLAKGTVAPVAAPPLAVLPGWQHRGQRLAEIGITDAGQFLEGDVPAMAAHLGVTEQLIGRWQTSLEQWLMAPAKRG